MEQWFDRMCCAVIQFAKKTGDYAVLSHADICILALTYALDSEGHKEVLFDDFGQPHLLNRRRRSS
jgi:rRNA maturation endonuclease Nob1